MRPLLTIAALLTCTALATAQKTTAPAILTSEDLEVKFAQTLAKAVFKGRWCPIENGTLGPDRPEEYTIISAVKSAADRWIITARIVYSGKDYTFPFPVRVQWAGETPVITVDNLTAPGGVYSARVMIFDKTYTGTWTAGSHGGLLHGLIVR